MQAGGLNGVHAYNLRAQHRRSLDNWEHRPRGRRSTDPSNLIEFVSSEHCVSLRVTTHEGRCSARRPRQALVPIPFADVPCDDPTWHLPPQFIYRPTSCTRKSSCAEGHAEQPLKPVPTPSGSLKQRKSVWATFRPWLQRKNIIIL